LKSENLVVINCWATWSGPSRFIAPKISQFVLDYPQVSFYEVEADEVVDVASELGVRVIPTFYFFKNGEKVHEVFAADPAAIKAAIEKYRA
jgi:thioredoxin 1